MTGELLGTLRAIVRDELARVRPPELGVVTQVLARDGDGSKNNHEVNVRLRGNGVELQQVPVVVGRLGLSALPQVGDLVLVTFVAGDLNAAVVVGCLYDDQAHPPVAQPHEVVYQPPDDSDSAVRRLHLELSSGATLTVGDDALTVTLGDTSIVVDRDGDVVIQSKGTVRLEAQGDLELGAAGNMTIEAQGSLSLKAMKASLEAQAQMALKGAQIGLAGMTQFSPS